MDSNPYASATLLAEKTDDFSKKHRIVRGLQLGSGIIALLPFCGYFVDVKRESSWIGAWLVGCWFVTLLSFIAWTLFFAFFVVHPRGRRIFSMLYLFALLVASLFGFGGVNAAVHEMLGK